MADDGEMPAPSLGEDSLPAPSGDSLESSKNQVNVSDAPDNIYLPTPGGGNDINYAPIHSSAGNSSSAYTGNPDEWKSGMQNRPVFSLGAGYAMRNYATTLVPGTTSGFGVNASLRLFDLGQTVFLHAMGGASFFQVGDVGKGEAAVSYSGVSDKTYHAGAMLEIGIGRRLSLFGTLMRRWNDIGFNPASGLALAQRDPAQLQYIGEEPSIKPGIGGQYDFYVIPHGSIGVQARLEQDYFYLGLSMALEPAPRKKMNLNFESLR